VELPLAIERQSSPELTRRSIRPTVAARANWHEVRVVSDQLKPSVATNKTTHLIIVPIASQFARVCERNLLAIAAHRAQSGSSPPRSLAIFGD
jgi:hypothetical protein